MTAAAVPAGAPADDALVDSRGPPARWPDSATSSPSPAWLAGHPGTTARGRHGAAPAPWV